MGRENHRTFQKERKAKGKASQQKCTKHDQGPEGNSVCLEFGFSVGMWWEMSLKGMLGTNYEGL